MRVLARWFFVICEFESPITFGLSTVTNKKKKRERKLEKWVLFSVYDAEIFCQNTKYDTSEFDHNKPLLMAMAIAIKGQIYDELSRFFFLAFYVLWISVFLFFSGFILSFVLE